MTGDCLVLFLLLIWWSSWLGVCVLWRIRYSDWMHLIHFTMFLISNLLQLPESTLSYFYFYFYFYYLLTELSYYDPCIYSRCIRVLINIILKWLWRCYCISTRLSMMHVTIFPCFTSTVLPFRHLPVGKNTSKAEYG